MVNEVQTPDAGFSPIDPRAAVVRPDRTASTAIQAVGEVGGDIVQGVQKKKTRDMVENTTQAFQAAAEVQRTGGTIDQEANAVINPQGFVDERLTAQMRRAQATSDDAFNKISAAIAQGKGSLTSGVAQTNLLIESEMRKIVNSFPGFEDVVRQSARDVLGYDPTGFAVRQLLDIADEDPRVNPIIQETRDEAEALVFYHSQYGRRMPMQTALQVVSNERIRKQKLEEVRTNVQLGQMTIGAAGTEFVDTGARPLASILDIASKTMKNGKGLGAYNDIEKTRLYKASVEEAKEAEKAAAISYMRGLSNSTGAILSDETVKSIEEKIDRKYQGTAEAIDWMDKTNILQDKEEELMALSSAQAWDIMPTLKFLSSSGISDSVASTIIETMANVSNQDQWSLLVKKYPFLVQAGFGDSPTPNVMTRVSEDFVRFIGGEPMSSDQATNNQLENFYTEQMWGNADSKERRNDILKQLANSRPKAGLKLVSADPERAFNSMDEDTKKWYAGRFATDLDKISAATVNEALDSFQGVDVDITGKVDQMIMLEEGENGIMEVQLRVPSGRGGFGTARIVGTDNLKVLNRSMTRLMRSSAARKAIAGSGIQSDLDFKIAMVGDMRVRLLEAQAQRVNRKITDLKLSTVETDVGSYEEKEINNQVKRLRTQREGLLEKAEDERIKVETLVGGSIYNDELN